MRVVSDLPAFTHRPLEIHVDPNSAESATVQRMALVTANLTARWARRVTIILAADVALDPELRRDGDVTLGARIGREMGMADPFGAFPIVPRVVSESGEALRLFVGPWHRGTRMMRDDDYQVHACGWTALGRRGVDRLRVGSRLDIEATAAAGLAGSLGAADLFKRAIGHSRSQWMPTFSWDTWSSQIILGSEAWSRATLREVPPALDLHRTLLAGVGAIGSAFVYVADLTPLSGHLTLLDRDAIEVTNLNRAPLFTVLHALDETLKTTAAKSYLMGRGLEVAVRNGPWRDHAAEVGLEPYDVWISLTNEDGAWAELPFQLPPVVLHATTTSGWGFGAGRHIPRREDCTLCRMPRPTAEFRGPCAEGTVAQGAEGEIRASLPFLSTAAASLLLASFLQLSAGPEAAKLPNDISVDLGAGLPAIVALGRGPVEGCRGCAVAKSAAWLTRGGRGRFAGMSL